MTFDPHLPADAALVVRAAFGDSPSLDRLLRAVQQPLHDHIAYILGHGDAANDVLQDVLLAICRGLGRLSDPRLFRAWSYRIATRAELVAALPAHVAELPTACGIVVRLRYLEELTSSEVAEALDLPLGTVKSRAAYGVALLRRRLAR